MAYFLYWMMANSYLQLIYHIRMDTIKCFSEKQGATQRNDRGIFMINEHILMNASSNGIIVRF